MSNESRIKSASAKQAIELARKLENEGKVEESAEIFEEAAKLMSEVRIEEALYSDSLTYARIT